MGTGATASSGLLDTAEGSSGVALFDPETGASSAAGAMARWQDEYARHSREQGYTQTVAGRRWRWKWRAQNPLVQAVR
jgi:hypothetical protein